tara:strand:- start:14712 stop:15632 length:921 start_codon:yes stop_codon:yes gene_type:complete
MTEVENNPSSSLIKDDEVDLNELFSVLWKEKIKIILITSIFAIGSVIYALNLTNYYESSSILVPRDNSENQGILSQYSGVASLVGVNISNSGNNNVMEVIETIKSREFLKHLLTFEGILPSIVASKNYDKDTKQIVFNSELYKKENNTWLKLKPSYIKAHESYVDNLLSISYEAKTGLVRIQIEHISPIFAKEFLDLIIKEINILKRNKEIESSSEALSYLKEKLLKTPLVEIKESINLLIQAQLEQQMLAQVHDDFSLVIVDPPFIPEKKSKPSRAMICILITFIGGLISLVYVLVNHYSLRKQN